MVNTARLNEKLVLKQLVTTVNEFGSPVETYNYFKTISGTVLKENGNNSFNDGNLVNNSISFYTRFYPIDLKGYRVEWNGNEYIINYVNQVNRRQALIINVSSIV